LFRTDLSPESPEYQIDLNSSDYKPNGWPTAGHSLDDEGQWLHNDIKDVAYFYNHKLFDHIVAAGGLK